MSGCAMSSRGLAAKQISEGNVPAAAYDPAHADHQAIWDALDAHLRQMLTGVIRRHGVSLDLTEEITQSFLVDVVMGRRLLERLERDENGNGLGMDKLVVHAAGQYVIDVWRARAREVRVQEKLRKEVAGSQAAAPFDRTLEYERGAAVAIVREALRRTERHYVDNGRAAHWLAFERRILQPAAWNAAPEKVKALAVELGFNKPNDLSSALQDVRQMVTKQMQRVVREFVPADQFEDAWHSLRRCLGRT